MSLTDVFLSPHYDDVCFSLSGTVHARQGGHLVNIYTQGDYSARQLPAFSSRDAHIQYVTNMRAEEDRQFADASHLIRHDMMFKEPGLSGIHPFDLSGLQSDINLLSGVLVDFLIGLQQPDSGTPSSLFCPMGIGGHRNHLTVLAVIVNALPQLRRVCDIFFYEDLYYASNYPVRYAGIARASTLLNGERLTRRVTLLSPENFARKMRLVSMYASQHHGAPLPGIFIPADTDIRSPHEAFWGLDL